MWFYSLTLPTSYYMSHCHNFPIVLNLCPTHHGWVFPANPWDRARSLGVHSLVPSSITVLSSFLPVTTENIYSSGLTPDPTHSQILKIPTRYPSCLFSVSSASPPELHPFYHHLDTLILSVLKTRHRRPSRWQKSKTWRSPSSPQIHQKYIYMWNNSYRTLNAGRRPQTSQKARNSPRTWVGQKEKEKTETKE